MVKLERAVHGPDVYEHDGDVDWQRVASGGASFAILKISEGDRIDSRATKGRVDAIRRAGLTAGAYVFLRPKAGRSGADEFRLFYEHGLKIGLWQRDRQTVRDLRPVLDCEATAFDTSTMRGRWQTRVYIRQAIRECVRLTGHKPIIYTGAWYWRDTIRCRWTLNCPLWLAAYVRDPQPYVKPWKVLSLWQFTDSHHANGISSECDYNVFVGKTGTLGEFRKTLTF